MLMRSRIVWVLLALGACAEPARPPEGDGRDTTPPPVASPGAGEVDADAPTARSADAPALPPDSTGLPTTRPDTLVLEGTPEPVTLHLYDEAGVPFVTYIPANDFLARATHSGEGVGVRFVAHFGGIRNPDAYVYFFFPARGSGLDGPAALRELVVGDLTEQNGSPVVEVPPVARRPCAWTDDTIVFRGRDAADPVLGFACFGERAGHPFYVLARMPPEYADGFTPRARLLLRELRWRDTGERLTPHRP